MGRPLRFLVTVFALALQLASRTSRAKRAGAGAWRCRSPIRWLCANSIAEDLASSACFAPARSADAPLTSSELFALPSMVPVRKALDAEFDRYIQRHKADLPNETIGVGTSFDFQLFDRAWLYSPDTRFVLAGIVNRMDRAYLSEANCGEIRLIYRLTRTDAARGRRSRGLAAAADDAQPRAEGQERQGDRCRRGGDYLRRDRAALACGGRLAADRSAACGKVDVRRWPAGFDRAGKHRPHRDQSSDRACAEIADPRFPHRLSAESV